MRSFAVGLCMIRYGSLVIEALTEEEAIDAAKEMATDGEIDWPLVVQIDGVEEIP